MPSNTSTFIIAEAGVNHNGSLKLAKKLVDVARHAGADAVKFQTFRAGELVVGSAPKAEYQQRTTGQGSQQEMIRSLELTFAEFQELAGYCREVGIEFLSTPFDFESAQMLVDKTGMRLIKIPSGEITNGPLLSKLAGLGRPLILSTGMSTMEDVHHALAVISAAMAKSSLPKDIGFGKVEKNSPLLKGKISLLQCTTEYPAPFSEINLRAMRSMAEEFGLAVGLSDHSAGIDVPIAAVGLGATIIEKHFTLDRNMDGPDHQASLEPAELKAMVEGIRRVEQALGRADKGPASSEIKNIAIARRSLVALVPIRKGERFSELNLTAKRPGDGISPMWFWRLSGEIAERDFEQDEQISHLTYEKH